MRTNDRSREDAAAETGCCISTAGTRHPADIRALVGEGPFLTDDKPAIEYFASLPQDERGLTRIGRDPAAVIRP